MKKTPTLAALALAALLAGCASPQRFQAPAPVQITPQPRAGQQRDLGGPYTREREDREFKQNSTDGLPPELRPVPKTELPPVEPRRKLGRVELA
jgi:hypothetical protein